MSKTKKNKNENYWNYRVLAHPDGTDGSEFYFQIHEVHYEDDKPIGYSLTPANIESDDPRGLRWVLKMMKYSLKKPILYTGDRWPQEFNLKSDYIKDSTKSKSPSFELSEKVIIDTNTGYELGSFVCEGERQNFIIDVCTGVF